MTSAHLRCEAIAKSFGARAVLREVDLDIAEATLTAILGSSGSGKTTLLRVIVGFIAPDAGTVTIAGSVVAGAGRKPVSPDKRAVGYVAQEGALYPHLSVGENVGFGLPRGERKRGGRIVEMLELAGLGSDYAERRPHELSGGEQRRVALARALAPRPRLVLLDEPFSGLDAALRGETRAAVLHALGQEGATAMMVTHDQAEALSTGDQVAVLRDGELVQTASPEVLYRTPADLDVARFVGEAVVIAGNARGELVSCALGRLDVLNPSLTGPVKVMIRPEQVVVTRVAPDAPGPPGAARARVVGRTSFGPDAVLALELEGSAGAALSARTFERDLPEPGEMVLVSVRGPVVTYPSRKPHDVESAGARSWAAAPEEEALAVGANGAEGL
ncbi:MAG TPA: ABC transporter ATP-binding protein [Solirubrobacteraceae bacterium]|nr:ABC transporter ATP-binding protein [Solirubrobacteraceae bacterium]